MKFIFPQNYNFKNKLFGFLDYNSLILNIIWDVFVFFFIIRFIPNITIKICIFSILCLPLFLFTFLGINNENIIYFLKYIIKYFIRKKLYLYK